MLVQVDHHRLVHQPLKPELLLPIQRHDHRGHATHLADQIEIVPGVIVQLHLYVLTIGVNPVPHS